MKNPQQILKAIILLYAFYGLYNQLISIVKLLSKDQQAESLSNCQDTAEIPEKLQQHQYTSTAKKSKNANQLSDIISGKAQAIEQETSKIKFNALSFSQKIRQKIFDSGYKSIEDLSRSVVTKLDQNKCYSSGDGRKLMVIVTGSEDQDFNLYLYNLHSRLQSTSYNYCIYTAKQTNSLPKNSRRLVNAVIRKYVNDPLFNENGSNLENFKSIIILSMEAGMPKMPLPGDNKFISPLCFKKANLNHNEDHHFSFIIDMQTFIEKRGFSSYISDQVGNEFGDLEERFGLKKEIIDNFTTNDFDKVCDPFLPRIESNNFFSIFSPNSLGQKFKTMASNIRKEFEKHPKIYNAPNVNYTINEKVIKSSRENQLSTEDYIIDVSLAKIWKIETLINSENVGKTEPVTMPCYFARFGNALLIEPAKRHLLSNKPKKEENKTVSENNLASAH